MRINQIKIKIQIEQRRKFNIDHIYFFFFKENEEFFIQLHGKSCKPAATNKKQEDTFFEKFM